MPGNRPLQARSGYNQGPQSMPLTDTKFLGQPAVKCGAGDTVLYRQARVSPGENNVRTIEGSPVSISGMLLNRTGGLVEARFIIVDDQNNEFSVNPVTPVSIPDGGQVAMEISPNELAFPLLEGWTIKVRVISGDPTAGQGLVAWPWAHDKTRNFIPVIVPLTTSIVEIGPPEGRAWQVGGSSVSALAGYQQIYYTNFDTVPRTVVDEIFHLADEDVKVNSGVIPINPRVAADSGVVLAYSENEFGPWKKGIILAYPDTIKFRAGENQTSAPLYLVATFAEFDLPKDLG